MFSAAAFLFAQWSPNKEKGRLIGFSQAGTSFGSVVASIFGGYLCEYGFYEGWGSIFILFGRTFI
jgi:ACS family sodium-dependent inorganic phosphate cotransporter-like MFS transporter 5